MFQLHLYKNFFLIEVMEYVTEERINLSPQNSLKNR